MKDRKSTTYRQCGMRKGNTYSTSWLPEQFCVVDKYIKLKRPNGSWDDGWQVISVGETVKTAEQADKASQLYKKTRLASDI